MERIFETIWTYAVQINALEAAGLIFGLLAVWLLIKQNIWTWPAGIIYVFISFVIFYQVKLYADLALHVVFLALNVYGWYYWIYGKKDQEEELPVTRARPKTLVVISLLSALGIAAMGTLFLRYTDAAVPYWDSTTTVLSLVGMWLTAKKKIENWHFWFVVDVLATGIYIYKG
ncbi:MAG TPA: nicotinamide riboside transporter PnuC, partial [Rhodothermales bacterium]|nr:nicotinamide riboside transporter PnuC [Rhodothermales bacterium]